MKNLFKCKIKLCILLFSLISLSIIAFIAINIPFGLINSFNGLYVTSTDISEIQSKNYFGPFVSATIKDKMIDVAMVDGDREEVKEVEFKLFHLIPLKTQKIHLIKENHVLVGGCAIGLVLNSDGVMIVGSSPIETANGDYDALKENDIQMGDIITHIEDETVENVSSITKIINKEKNKGRELKVNLKRCGREYETRIKPCYDNRGDIHPKLIVK